MPETKTQSTFSFIGIFSNSSKVIFSNLKLFIPLILVLFLISIVATMIFAIGGFELISIIFNKFLYKQEEWVQLMIGFPIIWIVMPVLIGGIVITLQTVFIVSLIKASSEKLKNKETNVLNCLKYAISKTGKTISTMLSIFWYIAKVVILPFLIILIVFAVFSIMGGDSENFQGLIARNPIESEQPAIESGVVEETELNNQNKQKPGGFLDPLDSVQPLYNEKKASFPSSSTILFGMLGILVSNMFLSILMLVAIVIGMILGIFRLIRSSLSLYAIVEDGLSGKKAVEQSINLIKGNYRKVISYITLIGAVSSSMSYLIDEFFIGNSWPSAIALGLLTGIISLISIVFLNILYKELKASKTPTALSPHTAQPNP